MNEDPWVIVSILELNLLNNTGDINLMPTLQVPGMIRDWVGEPGTEPDWLIEADRLLTQHHYRQFATDLGLDEEEIEEMMEGTPQDRAASFSFFG